MEYNTGVREWVFVHGVMQEAAQKVLLYMKQYDFTLQIMGYEPNDPDLLDKKSGKPFVILLNPHQEVNTVATSSPGLRPLNTALLTDPSATGKPVETPTLNDKQVPSVTGKTVATTTLNDEPVPSVTEKTVEPPTLNDKQVMIGPVTTEAPSSSISESITITATKEVAENSDDESTPSSINWKCDFDHTNMHLLLPEADSRYCFQGRDFDGVRCAECNTLFVRSTKGIDNCFKPTDKKPMYTCMNRREKCPYALCFTCHHSFLLRYVRK